MPKNPFIVLGLTQDATQSEILEAYQRLKEKYSDERFLEGEAGADAARKLNELYDAYNQAMEYSASSLSRATADDSSTGGGSYTVGGGGSSYENRGVPRYADVDAALKRKDYGEAQRLLDDISLRDAEWHYLQAAVFFNVGRLQDSRQQLDVAVEMEPSNDKYKNARSKMDEAARQNAQRHSYQQQQQGYYGDNGRSYQQQPQQQQGSDGLDTCCTACTACMCADCLCRMC